jgi:hypothetical protein
VREDLQSNEAGEAAEEDPGRDEHRTAAAVSAVRPFGGAWVRGFGRGQIRVAN